MVERFRVDGRPRWAPAPESETEFVLISGPDSATEIVAALAAIFDIKPQFYCTEVCFHLPLGASLSVNLGGLASDPDRAVVDPAWDVVVATGTWMSDAQLARRVFEGLAESTAWVLALHSLDHISAGATGNRASAALIVKRLDRSRLILPRSAAAGAFGLVTFDRFQQPPPHRPPRDSAVSVHGSDDDVGSREAG
ncbi:hypothetical protein J2W56_006764 [Nocardia kruczakiae]|uniref:Uncharacterized protein n=1 Tax=Nocardia kruczakiae TaxID=261477 RepID=A0ABU1XR11_9NOCA|nr:hypothetical protein [Nocardia kruczakiae]MDR7172998.1 hypothetical protein [Nocardia kruczakiae]